MTEVLTSYFSDLLLIALALLSCLVTIVSIRHWRLLAELKGLINFLRVTLRHGQQPLPLHINSKYSQTLLNLFNAYSSRQQVFKREKNTYHSIINLTTRISKTLSRSANTSHEVINLLHQQLGSDLVIIAIVRRHQQTNETYLERVSGISASRLADPLILAFDKIFSEARSDSWGYHSSDLFSIFPFQYLGIGYSLTFPLKAHGNIIGGLWLGFTEQATTFSIEKKNFVDGIAEHAAAILSIIDQTAAERKNSDDEKNLLLGLSHDIRSPGANALLTLRELLTDNSSKLDNNQLTQLTIIEQCLEEQNSLISDTLDYARHQKGLLFTNKQMTSMQSLLEQTIALYARSAKTKGISINVFAIEDILFQFDPKHFKRICSNFLSNAIKYTNRGQLDIVCNTDNGIAELAFADTGIGIPNGEASHLFEEFKRLSNAFNYPGTGLGLALCKILAKLNDADVFYKPNLGGGSVFGIRFRFAECKGKSLLSLPIFNRVLIVDDDLSVCRTNARYLRDQARELLQASTLSTAREILTQYPPDLIVSDLNLHAEKITTLTDNLTHIPTIILTGNAQDQDLRRFVTRENAIVLEKPVSREELLTAVSNLALG